MGIKKTRKGRYRIDYRDQFGVRQRRTYDRERDAREALARIKTAVLDKTYVSARKMPTLRAVAEEWYAAKLNYRPSSLAAWRVHLDRYLLTTFGDLRLDRIDVPMIEEKSREWMKLEAEGGRGIGPETVNKVLTTMTAIYKKAAKNIRGLVNVAALADRIRSDSGEITGGEGKETRELAPDEVYSPEELKKLIEKSDAGLYQTLFLVVAQTGVRHDEGLAICWGDFDWTEGQERVTIQRTLSWARVKSATQEKARPRFFPPKTKAGRRTIPLPPEIVAALKRWKIQCPPTSDEIRAVLNNDLVFPSKSGQPLHRTNVLRGGLYPAMRRAQLRQLDMHSLRHSFASILIMKGVPITGVQYYLGHSNPATTLKVYSHWFKEIQNKALNELARGIMGGAGNEEKQVGGSK